MTHFVYKKDNGDISDRKVIPIGFNFADRNSVLCIDIDGFDTSELEHLNMLREYFLGQLYDAGFGENIRSFYLDNIEEISE